jgi:serine/threonine protein kinase/tetratricopeptide (TPR) repeat protein
VSDPCNQAKSIFLRAIEEHAPEQWPGFLDQACSGDVRLRAEVEKLLRARSEMGSFHELPRPAALATALAPVIGERPGAIIGPYKVLEQIGEGGFGVVFMAEQTQPVRRKVALKVLKPGMDTRQIVARFEAERQALALMDHPNIAHVFDGGETVSGRPYFVMELVKGIPITDFCDQGRLTLRERLELFVHVCHAVQHAHHKGIIHRDIKPSNVLVTLHDGTPVAKVIDFGIAKAAGQQLTDKTLFTSFAQMIGTPLYMSPEQAALSGLDVDTRSDIYSLGVLLYELLTGTTPFDRKRFHQAAYDEIRRIIREEEPPKPSTRLSDSKDTLASVSAQRHTEPAKLTKAVRGELDWIVMKALEKDRNRRYDTANGIAMDIQHYLADLPVQACPPSAWYRFRKFALRNKTVLAATGVTLLFILSLFTLAGWAVRDRAAREQKVTRDRLAREAALDREANRAIDEARSLIHDGKWPEALAVVERTEAVMVTAGRQPEQRPHGLQELANDLAMAQRLEEIRSEPASQQPVPAKTSDTAGAQRLKDGEAPPNLVDATREEMASATALAFREYGIDVTVLPVAEAAERIRGQSIRRELAMALDFWSGMRRRSGMGRRGIAADNRGLDWKLLSAVAKLADPDPWRNQLREAVERGDRQALEDLSAAANIRLLEPVSLHLLGAALVEFGARKEAELILRQAQRQNPGDVWLNDALGVCLSGSAPDESIRFFTANVALRPKSAHFSFKLALAYGARETLEDIAEYTRAIELKPDFGAAWINRGHCYARLKQWEKALGDFTRASELDPSDTYLFQKVATLQAWFAMDKELADTCQRILDLAKNTTSPETADQVAKACCVIPSTDKAQLEAALTLARKAVDLGKNHRYRPFFQMGLGMSLYRSSHFAEADEALIAALRGGKTEPHVSGTSAFYLAMSLSRQGQPDDARKIATAATSRMKPLPKDERNPLADNDRPDDLILWMAYKEAKALIKFDAVPKAIELKPDSSDAWINRGEYHEIFQQWEWVKVLGDFIRASELDPSDAMLFQKVVTLQAWFAMDKELADTCQRGLDLAKNTTSPETADRVAKACCVIPPTDKAQLGAVLTLARKAVDLGKNHPYRPFFQMSLGMSLYRSSHFAEADEALIAALQGGKIYPHVSGTSAFYHAMSLFRQGQSDDARKIAAAAASRMKPFPKDEKNPLAKNANLDDLILWMAYKEAKALIKFDAVPAAPATPDGK